MPWKGVKFGPDGQNNLVSTVMTQVHDGAYQSIYPFNVAARILKGSVEPARLIASIKIQAPRPSG